MTEGKVSVAVLVRVSTVKDETVRQISELQEYAVGKGYEILEVCQDTISGTDGDEQRHCLRRNDPLAREGQIKKGLVHEIYGIARRNSVAHLFVETVDDF